MLLRKITGIKPDSQKRGSQSRKRRVWRYAAMALVMTACCAVAFISGSDEKISSLQTSETGFTVGLPALLTKTEITPSLTSETVDVFGGSMAHGWLDPNDDSYLRRAFAIRSASTDVTYNYVDHTIVGETPYLLNTQDPSKFMDDMVADKPNIVVLSWGLLNSMSSKNQITVSVFGSAVHQEIAEALGVRAVVLIVTPPVTEASATFDHTKQEEFIDKLIQEANSFHSPNVVVFNVWMQMVNYLTAHSQTYANYYGNNWHPNQAGHELAGMLLANDLMEKYQYGHILWTNSEKHTNPV